MSDYHYRCHEGEHAGTWHYQPVLVTRELDEIPEPMRRFYEPYIVLIECYYVEHEWGWCEADREAFSSVEDAVNALNAQVAALQRYEIVEMPEEVWFSRDRSRDREGAPNNG